MDKIDIILYINLDSREDRRKRITCELEPFRQINTKIVRISACAYPDDPPLGCLLSHIVALKYALTEDEYQNVLILEDDFSFTKNSVDLHIILNNFFTKNLEWDCVLLSYINPSKKNYDELLSYVSDAAMTSGYLINRRAINSLISIYQDAVVGLIATKKTGIYAADRIWRKLMKNNRWFIFNDRLGIQAMSYSDISKNFRSDLRDQEYEDLPKTYVIHHPQVITDTDILVGIMDRDGVRYTVSSNSSQISFDCKVLILLGVSTASIDGLSGKYHLIEDPDLYPTLTFRELLSKSNYLDKTCYIKVHAGLGNQLFQVATALSYCKRYNKDLRLVIDNRNDRGYYWDSVLSNYRDRVVERVPDHGIIHYTEKRFDYDEIKFVSKDILLEGYFQSSKYFKDVYINLNYVLPYRPKLSEKYVLVHARRGDYCIQPFLDKHGLLPDEYYRNAKNTLKERILNPIFVLTSDDPTFWPISNVFSGENVEYFSGNTLDTLSYFSAFRNIVISNSTFAWWGVYFAKINEGTDVVIAPRKWFGKLGPHETPDIYEENWIVI